MRRVWIAVALLIAAGAHAQRQHAVRPPINVPPAFRALYFYVSGNVMALENRADALGPAQKNDVAFAAELITANGNRGTDLLGPQTLAGVRVNLDALQRLGVNAVAVTIVYPLFESTFPRHADYLDFYKAVGREVRDRGMKLIVKVSVAFVGTAFSTIDVDYSTLTVAKLATAKHDMAVTVLRDLAPDYLNLLGEPDTEAHLTGLNALADAATQVTIVNAVLNGLNRGQTKIGAGTGTWLSPAFAEALSRTGIDYVDMHVYPLWPSTIDNMFAIADAAHRNGKSLGMSEVWLYKATPQENSNVAATPDIFRRDAFSFWSPLDAQFLHAIATFARRERLEFVSPFWSAYFFGNVTWSASTATLSYGQLTQLTNAAAAAAMVHGGNTPLGAEYGRIAAGR